MTTLTENKNRKSATVPPDILPDAERPVSSATAPAVQISAATELVRLHAQRTALEAHYQQTRQLVLDEMTATSIGSLEADGYVVARTEPRKQDRYSRQTVETALIEILNLEGEQLESALSEAKKEIEIAPYITVTKKPLDAGRED